jgi:arginine-tRNA-protein transferase
MSTNRARLRSLRLFLTAEHTCSYLPGRLARNTVADPLAVDNTIYTQLAELGFRRSGSHIYRPYCRACEQCLSLRIPVAEFRPNRVQRRTWRNNQDLQVRHGNARFQQDHYQLFARYLKARHPRGGMDETSPESYLSFITSAWSDTHLYEFRLDTKLLMVAVVDKLENGLSAVYTFFEPHEAARSLGTHAILWELSEAQRLGLPWVYLGYWVRGCGKMAYKVNFRPHQVFRGGQWLAV